VAGLWAKLLRTLARGAQGKLRFLDASHIKVHQDASNPAGGQQHQAIGRTKGGLNTKLSAWVDGRGRLISVSLAPGPQADVTVAQASSRPKLHGTITVADKGYDSDEFRAELRRYGSRACIPPRCNRLKPANWHRGHYRKRHKVENLFQRLKRHRRIGTRYEKNDLYFLAFVQLAAILDWLKN
jgi:transposase